MSRWIAPADPGVCYNVGMSHRPEINSILKQVQGWPPEDREALAKELLEPAAAPTTAAEPRDTLSRAKAIAASMTRPSPTDEEVEQWMDEHRVAKYGGGSR